MESWDRNLRAISYFAAFCGIVSFFEEKPLWMLCAWLAALMTAISRSLFTQVENYLTDGSQDWTEVCDVLLCVVILNGGIGGLAALGMKEPLGASALWATSFCALQIRIFFLETLRMEPWRW